MRKSTRNTFLLALAVVALGGAVYAELQREQAFAPQPLTTLDPAGLRQFEIRCQGCATRRFAREGDIWYMREPFAGPANTDAVARLLAILRAPVRTRAKLSDYDAARLGLAPAQFTLQYDSVRIEIGNEDPIEHDRYVHIGDELLRVPDRFSARLLESPESELADPHAAK